MPIAISVCSAPLRTEPWSSLQSASDFDKDCHGPAGLAVTKGRSSRAGLRHCERSVAIPAGGAVIQGLRVIQVYRLLRKLFFMSRSRGCNCSPMRRATVVAKISMINKCNRRETMGLYLS